jgi:acetyltransferase-like isoleucine patch superfamily enzyme
MGEINADEQEQLKVSYLTKSWRRVQRWLHRIYQRAALVLVKYGRPDPSLTAQIWRSYGAQIGLNVAIDPSCHIDVAFASLLEIQDNCVVAMGTTFVLHDSSVNNVMGGPMKVGRIVVEENAYIGACVLILPGVVIGRGSIVGAGSLVNTDIQAGTVVVGRPARSIGTTQMLLQKFLQRSQVPGENDMVAFLPFIPQSERAEISPDDMKIAGLECARQVAEWVTEVRGSIASRKT